MKFATDRPYADPEKAARKLLEIANVAEAVQDGRSPGPSSTAMCRLSAAVAHSKRRYFEFGQKWCPFGHRSVV